MSWNEPRRARRSVHHHGRHLGYVTTVAYPGRDLSALAEGTPFSEVVIADDRERHVALLQRFKAHWISQCGACYGTAEVSGELDDRAVLRLALFALTHPEASGAKLVEAIGSELEKRVGN